MPTIEYKYPIGGIVKVRALEVPGLIIGAMVDYEGVQYQTLYWNDGIRFKNWLYESELDEVKERPCGFTAQGEKR